MFMGSWSYAEEVAKDFEIDEKFLGDIIYANYDCPPYEGYAFVLTEIDDKLHEINGSHCSCNGLEGQWKPEEITEKELLYRIENGNGILYCNSDDILKALEKYKYDKAIMHIAGIDLLDR